MSEIQFANLVAKFSTVLSVGISDVATSMVLESITTRDGEPLDGGLYAFVIDRGLENEEFVIGTLAETGVFTFLVRGVSYIDGATSIPANIFAHRKGATIEITAHPVLTELVNRFTDFFNTYNGKWSGAVANYAALPEGQNDGEARITLDDSKIYVWSAAEESWKLSGAGGAGGTVYVTHKLGSESVGGDMKTFVLDSGSFPDDNFLQVYLNGSLQEVATDYTTSNNNTIIFENEVEATDKITMLVVSVSLVALGGVLTQDVIPDTDEAYNIGSDEYKVNEIHAKELNATNIIDPDNPVAQTPAQLIGGDNVVLQNFIDLGLGDNDGAFKVTIDGVEHDNVSVDLSPLISGSSGDITQSVYDVNANALGVNERLGQSFTLADNVVIQDFRCFLASKTGSPTNLYIEIYLASDDYPTGEVLATSTVIASPTQNDYNIFTFNNNYLKAGKYVAVLRGTANSTNKIIWGATNTNPYSGGAGSQYDSSIWSLTGEDFRFILNYKLSGGTDLLETIIQTAIRLKTGKSEVVTWDTDKFIVSGGGRLKEIGQFQPPTTGTDISGAGYLDLGSNAVFTGGDGDDYKLVRLDSDGQIPNGVSASMFNNINTIAKSLNTVYQNTTDKNKLVIASIYFEITVGADVTSVGQIGETNNPTTVVSTARIKGSSYPDDGTIPVFMLVKPGWYYRVSGGTSVASWFECDLI